MTRPIEPLHPSHPAHIVHHQLCNHVLRRVYKPSPDDPSGTGCICSHPPEEIVRPICFERGGVPCRIDELTYEAISLPIECNSCAEMRGSSRESFQGSSGSGVLGHYKEKETGGDKKGKNDKKQKGKEGGKAKMNASQTPATKLAMGLRGLGIQSPSSRSSGSDSGKLKTGAKSIRKSRRLNKDTVDEKVWKHLRSGPVREF